MVILSQIASFQDSSIYDLIFKGILQMNECSGSEGMAAWGCITGDISHDFIFGLLIPHIVIVVWLFLATRGTPVFREHRGVGNLIGLGAYLLVIYEGWYGSILAQFLVLWLVLTVITSLGYFFLSSVIWGTEKRYKLGKAIGKGLSDPMRKSRAMQQIDVDIRHLKKQLDKGNSKKNEEIWKRILALEAEKKKIQRG